MPQPNDPPRPSNPEPGQEWIDPNTHKTFMWDGEEWIEYDPVGKFVGDEDDFIVSPPAAE